MKNPKRRQPDISKAKEILGWEPNITLRDGLVNTIAYFDNYLRDDQGTHAIGAIRSGWVFPPGQVLWFG